MRLFHLPAAVLALTLAGCGNGIELTNASIADVASATASIEKPKPGQWSTSTRLVRFDPGADRSPAAAAIGQQVGETTTTDACLSGAEADKPLFGDLSPTAGANCTFRRFALKAGRLDATMACRNAGGALLTVRQQGSYSSTAVDLTATVERATADAKPIGGMTTRIVAKRTGECAATDG